MDRDPHPAPPHRRTRRTRRARHSSASWPATQPPVGAHLFDNLTGTLELLSVIPVFVLLALVLTGLIVAMVDSVRLRHGTLAASRSAW